MIIVKLQGGLGNQMFQYALGRNLSIIHKVPLKIDPSYLKRENQSARTLRINGFKTLLNEATLHEISAYRSTLQKILDRIRPESKRKEMPETGSAFDSMVLERSDGYFVGYWNNERYFIKSEKAVRQDFTLKNPLGDKAQNTATRISLEKESTSVHIRRGDYVTIKKVAAIHGVLPLSYYKTAMEKILESAPDAHFFVSSDDIDWAKENFPKEYPVTFVSSPDIPDYEEMILMSLCKHNIIANSTFSWWGAWLNANPKKIVIAPKHWFKDSNRVPQDLIPSSWIQL